MVDVDLEIECDQCGELYPAELVHNTGKSMMCIECWQHLHDCYVDRDNEET